jgi:hypothetical protein
MAKKVIFVVTKLTGYAGMSTAKVQLYAKQGLDALHKTVKGAGPPLEFQLALSTGGGWTITAGILNSNLNAVTNFGPKTIILNKNKLKTPDQIRTGVIHEGCHAVGGPGLSHAGMQTTERKAKTLAINKKLYPN